MYLRRVCPTLLLYAFLFALKLWQEHLRLRFWRRPPLDVRDYVRLARRHNRACLLRLPQAHTWGFNSKFKAQCAYGAML